MNGKKREGRYRGKRGKQTGKQLRIQMYTPLPLYGTPKNEESERCCLGSSMDICSHKAKTAYYSGLGLLCDLGECQIL